MGEPERPLRVLEDRGDSREFPQNRPSIQLRWRFWRVEEVKPDGSHSKDANQIRSASAGPEFVQESDVLRRLQEPKVSAVDSSNSVRLNVDFVGSDISRPCDWKQSSARSHGETNGPLGTRGRRRRGRRRPRG